MAIKKMIVQLPSFEISTPEGVFSVAASVEYDEAQKPVKLDLEGGGISGSLGLLGENRGVWASRNGLLPLPWLQKKLRFGAAGAATRRDLKSLASAIMYA